MLISEIHLGAFALPRPRIIFAGTATLEHKPPSSPSKPPIDSAVPTPHCNRQSLASASRPFSPTPHLLRRLVPPMDLMSSPVYMPAPPLAPLSAGFWKDGLIHRLAPGAVAGMSAEQREKVVRAFAREIRRDMADVAVPLDDVLAGSSRVGREKSGIQRESLVVDSERSVGGQVAGARNGVGIHEGGDYAGVGAVWGESRWLARGAWGGAAEAKVLAGSKCGNGEDTNMMGEQMEVEKREDEMEECGFGRPGSPGRGM